jgi:exopolyphosphatase/pppGpp-phosphohydrolase
MLKVSAIDVGSNAMRMVVGELNESWQVNAIENIRLPVRLGRDVFRKGYLEEKTIQETEEAFLRFKHVAESFDVHHLRNVNRILLLISFVTIVNSLLLLMMIISNPCPKKIV